MKKLKPYLINTVGFMIAFVIYQGVETIYMEPKNFMKDNLNLFYIIAILSVIVGVVIIWLVYRWGLREHNPLGFNQKPHFKWKNILIAILGVVVMLSFQIIFANLMKGQQSQNQQDLNNLATQTGPLLNWLIILIGPIFEEIIFRGILLNIILRKNTWFNKAFAIIIGGFIFGFAHEPSFSLFLLLYSGLGMILTTVYILTKDLRYSMIVHIINNWV